MSVRAAFVAALEALEVGDQASAVEVLLAAVEDGEVHNPGRRRRRCESGAVLWPGELQYHTDVLGHDLERAA